MRKNKHINVCVHTIVCVVTARALNNMVHPFYRKSLIPTPMHKVSYYIMQASSYSIICLGVQIHRNLSPLPSFACQVVSQTQHLVTDRPPCLFSPHNWSRRLKHTPSTDKKTPSEPLGFDVWRGKKAQSKLLDLYRLLVNSYKALVGANRRWQISECHTSPVLLPVSLWW